MSNRAAIINISDVQASYGSKKVLKGVSLSIQRNERWAIIGRNGTGKSTLIKLIAGLLHPNTGSISIDGIDLKRYSSRKRAQVLAYVPQKPEGVIPYSVYDFVMLGRYCYMGTLGVPSENDVDAVREAINICDISTIADRSMDTLSGGELQRVLLAGAVAQQTPILLLDEPTTFFDPAHERIFFNVLDRIYKQHELTTVMVTHDINTAINQCTHIGAMLDGQFFFAGTTREFASRCPAILEEIFSIRFERYIGSSQKIEVFGAWGGSF